MDANQINGALRAFLPVLMTLATAYGVLPKEIADQIPGAVYNAVIAVGGVVTLGMAVWSWFKNSRSSIVKDAASTPGVTVQVAPSAPPDIKAVAMDPAQPAVVLKPTA